MGQPKHAMGPMAVERVTITERKSDWILRWEDGSDAGREKAIQTAGEALGRVREYGKILARDGISTVLKIDWKPRSRIGHMVVKALSDAGRLA